MCFMLSTMQQSDDINTGADRNGLCFHKTQKLRANNKQEIIQKSYYGNDKKIKQHEQHRLASKTVFLITKTKNKYEAIYKINI